MPVGMTMPDTVSIMSVLLPVGASVMLPVPKVVVIVVLLTDRLPRLMLPGGEAFVEIGAGQGEELLAMFAGENETRIFFEHVEVLKDYAGRDRVLHVRMAGNTW